MTRALLAVFLFGASCSSATPGTDADLPDASADAARPDVPQIAFVLGARTEPFTTRTPGDSIEAVFGPQGGVHTEHSAFVGDEDLDTLHEALIWVEVSRDGSVLARAGWEFWNVQWEAQAGGYAVELPVLIFDDVPTNGPLTLRGELELTDGRTALYEEDFELVVQ